jgi:hypothetical protein
MAMVAGVLAACTQPGPASPSATSPGVTPSAAPSIDAASAPPSSDGAPGTLAPSVDTGTGVAVDLSLLEHLPDAVDGVALEPDPETSAQVAADPSLAIAATGLVIALAAAETETTNDLAIVSAVRLRPGIFGDAFFRSWRDSYDTAACKAAGGVGGNAEAEIAGRTTYIGTCVGGAHTYHVRLDGDDVVVSVTSVGERRLGEQVIASLTE